jgi:hypothetical protein
MKALNGYHLIMGFHALAIGTFIVVIVDAYYLLTNTHDWVFSALAWMNGFFIGWSIIGFIHALKMNRQLKEE